nr:hypothetical protein [Tanacetum cinerariifolium]
MLVTMGEGSGTLTEPHHTPSLEAPQTSPTTHSSPSLPLVTTEPLPTDTPQLRQYTRRARIAQSSALPTVAEEHASPLGDDSQGDDDPSGEDATIMGTSLETEEEACIERSTEKRSDDTEEM